MSNNFQVITPYSVPTPGGTVVGGGGTPLAGYRDLLDAKRSAAVPKTPESQYPSGYLGNIVSRRSDRLLQAVQSRLTQHNYQRGVHKGERVDPSDYFWPEAFNPDSGLEAEAAGLKWAPNGVPPQINHMGKNQLIDEEQMYNVAKRLNFSPTAPIDPRRKAAFSGLLPSWSK